MYETLGFRNESNAFDTPIDGFNVDANNFSRKGRKFQKPGMIAKPRLLPHNRHTVKFHSAPSGSGEIKIRPLEEHFENFVDTTGEVAENLFGALKKLIAKRSEIKNKKKLAKADVIQAKADAERIRANADAQAAIIAAQQQASQTNQLQQQIYPGAAAVQPQSTPQYQTLPDTMMQDANNNNWKDVVEPGANAAPETLAAAAATPAGKQKTTADKRKKMILFAVIALVVIAGVIYFVKRKKFFLSLVVCFFRRNSRRKHS